MTTFEPTLTFDFRKAIDKNHLRGIWKMMVDYRLPYLGATLALAVSALAKTGTYLLLRYFADEVVGAGQYIGNSLTQTFLWLGAAFVGLALVEGGFSFLSGRLAAYTAEGITRRLRDFLFDQWLGQGVTADGRTQWFDALTGGGSGKLNVLIAEGFNDRNEDQPSANGIADGDSPEAFADNMRALLAAIHAIPPEYLEAARVDGATGRQRVRHIVVPLLRPTIVNLAILDFIGKMKQFALVWVMTRGGPKWGTETVATYVVKRAFEWKTLDLGYPSAIAVIWFVLIFGLSYAFTRLLQRREALEF